MIYTLIAVVGIAIFILCVVLVKRSQMEEKKYYDTAKKMLKEDYLKQSLENRKQSEYYMVTVPMLYMRLTNPKPAQGYVFNPEKPIVIGRDKASSSIWMPYPTISMKHCSIYESDGMILLQDENSMNGTIVKRGFHRYMVSDGCVMQLESGDRIMFDEVEFKLKIFYFQAMKR